MLYHAIYHNDKAVIRLENDGINDTEWEHGCRIIRISYNQLSFAQGYIKDTGYEVLTRDEWSSYIDSLDDPSNVPNNSFVSTRPIKDKWDLDREIY